MWLLSTLWQFGVHYLQWWYWVICVDRIPLNEAAINKFTHYFALFLSCAHPCPACMHNQHAHHLCNANHISKPTLTICWADSTWQHLADHSACPMLYSLSDSTAVWSSRVKKSLLELYNTWQITKQLNAVKNGESCQTWGEYGVVRLVIVIVGWYC